MGILLSFPSSSSCSTADRYRNVIPQLALTNSLITCIFSMVDTYGFLLSTPCRSDVLNPIALMLHSFFSIYLTPIFLIVLVYILSITLISIIVLYLIVRAHSKFFSLSMKPQVQGSLKMTALHL